MTDSIHIRPINESVAAMRNFNEKLHDLLLGLCSSTNAHLAMITRIEKKLDSQDEMFEQVFQRLDILEKGQKLDRKGRDMDTDDFEKLVGKVQSMDEKLTARLNDMDDRMKVSPRGTELGVQMLEIIEDSGTVNEALQSLARESARDVLADYEVDGENIKNLGDYVEVAIDNTDISDKIDFHALHASQFDLDDWKETLGIDDINEKIDKLVRIIATARLLIERIGDTDV
jgi:septation ring formation regulator EzrA